MRSHRSISTLTFPKSDDMHEGAPLVGHGFAGYGGSKDMYRTMCRVNRTTGRPYKSWPRTEDHEVDFFRTYAWHGWSSWNLSKPLLAVKDPPNLLRMRYLQKAFQETHDVFAIFTIMHPLEIGSMYKCEPDSYTRQVIVESWLNCQRNWLEELAGLKNYLIIPFEAWFKRPIGTGRAIESFLHLKGRTNVELPRRLRPRSRRLVFHGNQFILSR